MAQSAQPETDLRNEIKQYLELDGWYVIRIQQLSNRKYRAQNGISDLISIKNGIVLFIEIKTDKGVQSEKQIKFEADIKNQGGKYFVVRSIEDMEFHLSEEGLL